jgi:hypothetical protein
MQVKDLKEGDIIYMVLYQQYPIIPKPYGTFRQEERIIDYRIVEVSEITRPLYGYSVEVIPIIDYSCRSIEHDLMYYMNEDLDLSRFIRNNINGLLIEYITVNEQLFLDKIKSFNK